MLHWAAAYQVRPIQPTPILLHNVQVQALTHVSCACCPSDEETCALFQRTKNMGLRIKVRLALGDAALALP